MSIEARQIQKTLYSYAAILNFTPSSQGLRAKFGACSVQNAQLLRLTIILTPQSEEVGSPSLHALQLINIQSRDFLQCLLEKLWKFISFFRQECLVFLKVSFYGCFKYESNLTTFALFGILMRCIYANRHLY